jgi:hypothetical protein
MQADQEIIELLKQIRDSQQALLGEYTRVANAAHAIQCESFAAQKQSMEQLQQSVEKQRDAIGLAQKNGRLYRRVLIVAAVILALMFWVEIHHGWRF